jgi:hypothetical protein
MRTRVRPRLSLSLIRSRFGSDKGIYRKQDVHKQQTSVGANSTSAQGQVQTLGRFRKCGIMELRMRNPKLDFEDQAMEVLP